MARSKGESANTSTGAIPPERLHLWQIQAVRDVLVIIVAVLIVWAGYAMRTVTVPLLVALLLAYLFEPLIAKLSKHPKLSRPMVVGGLLLCVGAAVIAILAIVVPLLIGQTIQLVDDFRDGKFARSAIAVREYVPEQYRDEFDRVASFVLPKDIVDKASDGTDANKSNETESDAAEENHPSVDMAGPPTDGEAANEEMSTETAEEIVALRQEIAELRADVNAMRPQADSAQEALQSGNLVEFVRRGLNIAFMVIGEIISIGLLAFLIPFYFYFFSVWYPSVMRFGNDLIPKANRRRVVDLLGRMDRAVAGFVRGRIVISLIMSVMLALGWSIVGVQYAIVLGFVIGFFSIVPYLGSVGFPAAIILLWVGQVGEPEGERMAWYMIIFWPTLVFTIVQIVEGYVLTPMIAGKATNLDPVTILVAVLAGGSIMGVYGMLLAIPLAACLKIVFVEVLLPRIKAWSAGKVEDPLPIENG